MKKHYFLLLLFGFLVLDLSAQGYHAIHGSPYAGSTAMFNNPAATVNSVFKWDLTLLSTQIKISSNSTYVKDFPTSSTNLVLKDGFFSRFLHTTVDFSLFDFSYRIDNNKAFSVGLRGRTYNHFQTGTFNYVDSTVNNINSFLVANRNTSSLDANLIHTGWMEADLNYAQVLMENSHARLSGGITLQVMKGLSGAYSRFNKISYLENKQGTDTSYTFTNGNGSFAFSDNYDQNSVKDFFKSSRTGLALSLGIEYMAFKPEEADEGKTLLNYDWKIGLSIMDIGANSFIPNRSSGQFYTPNAAYSDADINRKFNRINNINDFRDSLNTLFANNTDIKDNYAISLPTRFIANFDKNLGNHFYLNGELSMNFYSANGYNKLRTRELNLLTITPRYETIGLGAYLPVQYNAQGQVWVGAAVKLGPLLLGIHDLGIFSKAATLNGGGYLKLSIHPFGKRRTADKFDCPA